MRCRRTTSPAPAFLLYTAAPYFPPGSVHLAVVDPGVGSRRRPIAIATERAFYVGPDNGLFTYVLARDPLRAAVELREPRFRLTPVSDTFHGRDIFAPAAAHLASGGELGDLGPPVSDLVRLPPLRLEVSGAAIQGAVLHADRFGNAITSIGPLGLGGGAPGAGGAGRAAALQRRQRGRGGGWRTPARVSSTPTPTPRRAP
jgi:S-adenosylmethionine hydrolase